MAFFVLRKLILQTRMRSHPVRLDIWFLVRPFVYFHTSCVRTANALARLHGCAGLPDPSLVAYVISTIISWDGSIVHLEHMKCLLALQSQSEFEGLVSNARGIWKVLSMVQYFSNRLTNSFMFGIILNSYRFSMLRNKFEMEGVWQAQDISL